MNKKRVHTFLGVVCLFCTRTMWKSLNICTTNSIAHTYSTKLSNSVLQYFKLHFACVLQVLDNVGVT